MDRGAGAGVVRGLRTGSRDPCGGRVGAGHRTDRPDDTEAGWRGNRASASDPPTTVIGTEGSIDARTQLRTGRMDGASQGNETIGWLPQNERGVYRVLGSASTENLAGMPVPDDEPALLDAVQAAPERPAASGAHAEPLKTWGLGRNAVEAATADAGR